jgi:hypothetical protein
MSFKIRLGLDGWEIGDSIRGRNGYMFFLRSICVIAGTQLKLLFQWVQLAAFLR